MLGDWNQVLLTINFTISFNKSLKLSYAQKLIRFILVTFQLINDPFTKQSKEYGFVTFSSKEEADLALCKMNGKYLNGKKIKTSPSYNKKGQFSQNLQNQTIELKNTFY